MAEQQQQITETTERVFEYRTPEDLKVWGEPKSPERWNKELAKIGGRDPHGDVRLRVVWGGTAVKDSYAFANGRNLTVKTRKYMAEIPKVRVLKGYSYFCEGGTKMVSRADLVPAGKIAIPEYDYIELGILRWVLERKFTAEELVEMQMRPDPDSEEAKTYGIDAQGRRFIPPLDPRGEYLAIYPLETPEGGYFEPNDQWLEGLRRTQQQINDGGESDALTKMLDRYEKEEEAINKHKTATDLDFLDNAVIEAEKELAEEALNKVYF